MKTLKLRNVFHGTECRIRVPESWTDRTAGDASIQWDAFRRIQLTASYDRASAVKLRRIRRELCGMDDCACGTLRPR